MATKERLIIKSDDDLKLYEDDMNYKVVAGPGAGKTHLVIENIKRIVEKSKKLNNSERKICCITYTNVAVDEIKSRLADYVKYTHVSTIHSFLNEYVIKPFGEQLSILLNEIFGIKVNKKKSFSTRQEGFSLLYKHKLEDINAVLGSKGIDTSKVKDKSYYELICLQYDRIIPKNVLSKNVKEWEFKEIIRYKDVFNDNDKFIIKKAILEQYKVLDFDDILFFSLLLVMRFPHIAKYLRYTFPYLIIDEYQDTVKLQNMFVKHVFDNSSVTLLLVGDPAQAIYGFAGAEYTEFYNFNTINKPLQECIIKGNRRSGENIVAFLNFLREKDAYIPEQVVIGDVDKSKGKVVFILDDKAWEQEQDKFDIMEIISKDVNVLTRRWTDAFLYLKDISKQQRENIKKIHAYWSYVIGRDIFSDFEKGDTGWISQVIFISTILKAIERHDFYAIVKVCSKIFDLDNLKSGKTSLQDINKLFKFIEKIKAIRDIDNYGNMIQEINKIAEESGLMIVNKFEIVDESCGERYFKFYEYLNDLNLDSINLIVNEVFVKNGKYTSIHKTKGKEYNSVLTDFEVSDSINHYDIKMLEDRELFKDYNNNAEYIKKVSENLRIIYVACSRAKENLYISIKGNREDFKFLEKKMDDYIKKKKINEFYIVKTVTELKESKEVL